MKVNLNHFIIMLIFSSSTLVIAHGTKNHDKVSKTIKKMPDLELVNERYIRDVKTIFQKKCFDCHSGQTVYPWYSKIPWIKQLINSDIIEGRKHMDMESDFPFKSHATPLEDLEELDEEVVESNKMPPLLYRVMHRGSALTQDEKKIVHEWVEFGKDTLSKN